MSHDPSQVQEPQTERGAVMLTKAEKIDVQLVSAFDARTESDTLRNHTVSQIRERAAHIRGKALPGEVAGRAA